MVPLIVGWNKLASDQKLRIIADERELEEKEADRIIDDSWHDKRVRRDSPVVQKRLEVMERTMAQAMAIASRTQRGMAQKGSVETWQERLEQSSNSIISKTLFRKV